MPTGKTIEHRRVSLHCSGLISKVMCFLGLLGVLLMITVNELSFTHAYDHDRFITTIIKLTISMSTVMLIGLVFYYHYLDAILYCVNHSLDHWRIGLTRTRVCFIVFEALVCAIHPFPRSSPFRAHVTHINATVVSAPISLSDISLDVALGLPSKY